MCRRLPNLTKSIAILCSRSETNWQIRFGLPTLTRIRIWLGHHSIVLLPTLTSRGVKYTHDINRTVLHSDRGPTRIRLIPQEHIQEVIPVGDGGAKHRSIDTPWSWHSVADPHAVATIPQGGPDPLTPRSVRRQRTTQYLQSKHTILVKRS